jgi:hypothetical protein
MKTTASRMLLCVALISLFAAGTSVAFADQANTLRFQRPDQTSKPAASQQAFRSPSQASEQVTPAAPKKQIKVHTEGVTQAAAAIQQPRKAVPRSIVTRNKGIRIAQRQNDLPAPKTAETSEPTELQLEPIPTEEGISSEQFIGPEGYADCGPIYSCDPECGVCDPGCGVCDPGCGVCDPACGVCDPACGVCDPACGVCDPACGIAEPSCGVATDCGSSVGIPGPEYWCFPVCLPRLKDFSMWAGVQGFRGPRDFIPNGRSDSNFGFHEGFNLSGRAPLVSMLFPELSYQFGYQAFQSRLAGTVDTAEDRGQQFITAGLYRRVNQGFQFGVVWDYMYDDLDEAMSLNQVRYEMSIKTPRSREIGFWGASSTNDSFSDGVNYSTVDQYALFYRWNFRDGYQGRLWGGASGDGEGLFGADFYAPLNDRWSVQTGFNYLIPDQADGPEGVSQESWNIGINLVWHIGRSARQGARSPFRPLFPVADNGWMFVDQH